MIHLGPVAQLLVLTALTSLANEGSESKILTRLLVPLAVELVGVFAYRSRDSSALSGGTTHGIAQPVLLMKIGKFGRPPKGRMDKDRESLCWHRF